MNQKTVGPLCPSCLRPFYLSIILGASLLLHLTASAVNTIKFVNNSACTVTISYKYWVRDCGGGVNGWFPSSGPCGLGLSAYSSESTLCAPIPCIGGEEISIIHIIAVSVNGGTPDTTVIDIPFATYGSTITAYFGCGGLERITGPLFDNRDFPRQRPCPPYGMPVWEVSEPWLSVWLLDTPISYQPGLGPPISFDLAYKQRESVGGLDPNMFGVGQNWNFSWLSFVSPGWNPITGDWTQPYTDIYFADGGRVSFQGSIVGGTTTYTPDYLTNTRLSNNSTTNYSVTYPDGSKDVFGFIVTNNSGGFLKAMLTERWNATGQKFSLYYAGYNPTNPVVRLLSVVDGDGRTNSVSYVTNNAYSTNLISQVTDPFGRSVTFSYDTNGFLTGIVDPVGISSSMAYDSEGRVTSLTTPYGTTSFQITDTLYTNLPPYGRSVRILKPDGSCELFVYTNGAPGIASSYPTNQVPSTSPFSNTLDNSALDQRNTFHWTSRQYATLSTTNISILSSNDFLKAHRNHWLLSTNSPLGTTVSINQLYSPDGNTPGQVIWFDYSGKASAQYEGAQVLPLFTAQVLPDGSTRFTRTDRNTLGFPITETSTYSGSSSVLLRTNTYTYAANGIDLLYATNALRVQVSTNSYNAYHQLLTNANALGELTVLTYNANQQLSTITHPTGLITTNIFSSSAASTNLLSSSIDYAIIGGSPVYYRTNSYTWTNDLVLTHTDPLNLNVTNTWDALARLIRRDFPDGTSITNAYSNLSLVQTIDRMGFSNSFGYNALQQLIAVTNANGAITRYGYCSCGALEAVTNAFGTSIQQGTSYAWDLQGNLLQSVAADGYTLSYGYNVLGQLTNLSDGLKSITNTYNNQGLQISFSCAYGQIAAATFDILDRVTNSVDANGVTITNTFDTLNRLLTRGHPDGGIERLAYTPNIRNATSYTNQLGTNMVNYAYDPLDRKTTEVYPGIATNSFGYDGAGNLVTLTDGKGQITTLNHDSFGRTTNKLDAANNTIFIFGYDPNNRLTNRWTPAKGTTSYRFDPVGNLTNITYPTSPSITFGYDLLNRPTNMVDAVGTTRYTYTGAGLLQSEDGPWPDDTISFTYNASRQRIGLSLLTPNASPWNQTYSYDVSERLSTISSPAGTFTYAYDPTRHLQVNKLSLPNGAYVTNNYDPLARLLSTALRNSGNAALNSHTYGYNVASQRMALTNMAGDYRTFAYDNLSQLTGAHGSEASGAARWHEQLGYTYDPAGSLTYRTNNDLIQTFALNSLNELTTVSRTTNMTVAGTTTSTATNVTVNSLTAALYSDCTFARTNFGLVNGTNSFTAIGADNLGRKDTNSTIYNLPSAISYSYDLNGNLLNDATRYFTYDDENQLISVIVTNNGGVSTRSDFVYDGKMRRRIRVEYAWEGSSWVTNQVVRYVCDSNLVIEERDGNNLPCKSYTRGADLSGSRRGLGGIGGLLALSQPPTISPQHYYYHADGSGNITALLSTNQGLVAGYSYDPFGNLLALRGPLANANLYRFSSKEIHVPTGLVYYSYRYFDPDLQRWLNRDPLAEMGGINLYGFVGNTALNGIDTDGRFGHVILGAAIGGVLGAGISIVSDLLHQRDIDWAQAGISASEGAFAGAVAAATFGTSLAGGGWALAARGAFSGLAGDAAAQALGLYTGSRDCFNFREAALSAALGAGAPFVGKFIAGLLDTPGITPPNLSRVDEFLNEVAQSEEANSQMISALRQSGEPLNMLDPASTAGRGSSANLSAGTTVPRTVSEQLAVEAAAADPTAGLQLPINMTDPRWPSSQGWVKMEQVVNGNMVHYVYNTVTRAVDDFKIVLPGRR